MSEIEYFYKVDGILDDMWVVGAKFSARDGRPMGFVARSSPGLAPFAAIEPIRARAEELHRRYNGRLWRTWAAWDRLTNRIWQTSYWALHPLRAWRDRQWYRALME